jgi:drug/metabolite transporter (DMT)-like permease
VVGALAIGEADPLPLLALRFTLAALVAVPLALRSGRWRGAPLGRLATVGVLLQVVQFGGVYGGFALGVPAALSALAMLGLSPLVTTGLAVGSGQERGDARLWAGLAVGVVGVAISLAPELGSARAGVGVAVTLVGMLGLASATVLQKRWGAVADPRVSVAAQAVTGALIVDPAALVFGGHVDVSARLVLCTAWLAWGLGIVSLLAMVSTCAATRPARSRRCCSPCPPSPRSGRQSSSARRCTRQPAGDARGHGRGGRRAAPRGPAVCRRGGCAGHARRAGHRRVLSTAPA